MKETSNPTESKSDAVAPSDEVVTKANELYWHSEESVNQLARELDLSKGTLYEILAPLPADLRCPHNDGDLSYPNRTARDRGFVSCATCGFEDEEDQVRALLELQDDLHATELGAPDDTAATRSPASSRAPAPHGAAPLRPDPSRPRRLETLVVLSVLTGLTAGFILGGLFRRR
ncbi:MAG: hypothetical protein F4Y07_03810 [Gemmatimonadetes bacterium]|nr:hypothetical protein [Gemmatimonadota bacterium]